MWWRQLLVSVLSFFIDRGWFVQQLFVRRYMLNIRILMLKCRTEEERNFVLSVYFSRHLARTPDEIKRADQKILDVCNRIGSR